MPREQRRAFQAAIAKLIEALREGGEPPNSLRVKRVQGTKDVWEMSYSGDGRATFRYGAEVEPGETHVEWLRVGGHEIFFPAAVGPSSPAATPGCRQRPARRPGALAARGLRRDVDGQLVLVDRDPLAEALAGRAHSAQRLVALAVVLLGLEEGDG
jgi:hypothetical protein